MLRVLEERGHDVEALLGAGRLSILRPEPTCDDTVAAVSRHFQQVLGSGATFIRFIGNAAVGREGWPSEEEFYKLEATVSAATLDLPCVAICMFDLRTQSARTIVHAAIEGHPVFTGTAFGKTRSTCRALRQDNGGARGAAIFPLTPLHGRILDKLGVSRVISPSENGCPRRAWPCHAERDRQHLSRDVSIVEVPAPEICVGRTLNS